MKKILYAALGLSIFIFGGSQLLTQAANTSQSSGTFGVNSGCLWTHDETNLTFVVEPVAGQTTCQLVDYSAWYSKRNEIKSFKIKSGVKAPTNMNYFFQNLGFVENIDINSLDVSKVETMEQVFSNFGSGVAELDLSNWDTSKVTRMVAMFFESKIKSLNLGSGFVTSGATSFYNMFAGSAFEELTLDFDTRNVTNMNRMFADARNLTKLDISEFDMSKFEHSETSPNEMFENVGILTASGTEIKINDTFKKGRGDGFDKYRFPSPYYKLNGGKILELGKLYREIKNLSGTITLTPVLPPANGGFFGYGCQWTFNSLSGSFVVEPVDVECELKENSKDVWLDPSIINDITSFTINSGVKAPINMASYFYGMKYVEEMNINDLDVSAVENMASVFYEFGSAGSGITELVLSNWDTSNVDSMWSMFYGSNIKNLKLGSGFDTSSVTSFTSMFTESNFEKLTLNFDTTTAESMNGMFYKAKYLKELDVSSFSMSGALHHWTDMFYNVGTAVTEGTTIKLNKTFADKVSGLNFPASGYKLDCENFTDNFVEKSILSDELYKCIGTGTLTPAYDVYFDYNGGNSGGARHIFLLGEQINTFGITPTKSGHILLKWTDTQDVTSATIEIPAGAKSQTGYGAYYTDNNPKTLYAQWKEEYKVTSGDNQTYTKGSNTDIIIETNTDEIPNGKIWLDGVEIPKTGYSHNLGLGVSGSLVLTLKSAYLDTLSAGDHTVKMMFYSSSNGDYTITATLTIKNQTTGGGGGSGGRKRNTTPVILSGSEESSEQLTGDVQEPEEKSEFELAYEFAFKHGITTMDTIEKANMTGNLTRIAMAKMLSYYAINVLGQTPDTTKVCEFDDVSAQDDLGYNNGVTLTCQLGFMGVGMKNFRPYDTVIRAEFVTALSRMLFGTPDGDSYYVTHLQKLKSEGIIKNDDPNMVEVRGYTMIMLMRSKK